MLSAKNILAAVFVVTLGLVGGALVSGCDFHDIGAGTDSKLDGLLTSLSEATTVAEAESAMRDLMVEVGVNNPAYPGPYSYFTLSDRMVATYAEQVVAYNTGLVSVSDTYGSVVSRYARGIGVSVQAEQVVDLYNSLLVEAFAAQKESPSRLLLAAAVNNGKLPSTAPQVASTDEVAPFQRYLFTVWLSRGVDATAVYHSVTDGASKRPASMVPVCHFAPGQPVTIYIPGNQTFGRAYEKHLAHGDFPGVCTVTNCQEYCYVLYPCSETPYTGCEDDFAQCIQDCHDQGTLYGWPLE